MVLTALGALRGLRGLRGLTAWRAQSLSLSCRRYLAKYTIAEALRHRDNTDTAILRGWVKSLRIQKKYTFIDINDGSSNEKLQVFLPTEKTPDDLSWGSSVEVTGHLSTTPRGQIELVADCITVVGSCIVTDGYPFNSKQNHPPEYLRQYLHLRSRTKYISSIFRIRDAATRAVYQYFNSLNYINIHTPILTSNDCEGAGEMFRVEPENVSTLTKMYTVGVPAEQAYFNKKAFLTVSGQLHLEAAAHGLGRVYTFGPTFRAENSKSRMHLAEFYMIEAETAFVSDLNDVIEVIENLVKYVTNSVLSSCESDVFSLRGEKNAIDWLNKPFIKITYDEAVDLILKNKHKFKIPLEIGQALRKEHELLLVDLMNGTPTFVINWPKNIKPFYMRSLQEDDTKVAALDLLAPITGEIAGGSLRENNYEILKKKMPSPDLNWYLELRKFGSTPTGGFGLGFERYLQLICNVTNIKDTIPYPRWPHNCSM